MDRVDFNTSPLQNKVLDHNLFSLQIMGFFK